MLWDNVGRSKKPLLVKIGLVALGAALFIGTSSAAIAQNLIVRSVGPSANSYPTGKKLAGGTKVTLKKLDKVTILGSSGTRVLKGPGTFTIGGRSRVRSSSSTRLSSYIGTGKRGRPRTGAVRRLNDETGLIQPENPSLWYLDVNQSGKFCVEKPNALVIWRPDLTGSATASVVEPTSGTITKISWGKGSELKAWPRTEAPVTQGAKYQLIGSNLAKTTEIEFVVLNSLPKSPEEAATMLIENQCFSQLESLADKLETDSTAKEG